MLFKFSSCETLPEAEAIAQEHSTPEAMDCKSGEPAVLFISQSETSKSLYIHRLQEMPKFPFRVHSVWLNGKKITH